MQMKLSGESVFPRYCCFQHLNILVYVFELKNYLGILNNFSLYLLFQKYEVCLKSNGTGSINVLFYLTSKF